MRITKYVHSCLLAESSGVVVLFDPGIFSWESGLFDVNNVGSLDRVVITHEHPDHFNHDFIKEIIKKFPEAEFISTAPVLQRLEKIGVVNLSSESSGKIEIFSKKRHASLGSIGEAPENIAVHFDGLLTVGGDRHDLEDSKDILALTATAPWGSMVSALDMAIKLKPKKVLPVHDWHWGEAGKAWSYELMKSVLVSHDIEFITLVDGEPIEL